MKSGPSCFPCSYLTSLPVRKGWLHSSHLTECRSVGWWSGYWGGICLWSHKQRDYFNICFCLLPYQDLRCWHILSRMFSVTPGSSWANAINHSLYTVPQLSFRTHPQRQCLQWDAGTDPTDSAKLLIKLLDLCEPDDIMLIVWRKKKKSALGGVCSAQTSREIWLCDVLWSMEGKTHSISSLINKLG